MGEWLHKVGRGVQDTNNFIEESISRSKWARLWHLSSLSVFVCQLTFSAYLCSLGAIVDHVQFRLEAHVSKLVLAKYLLCLD